MHGVGVVRMARGMLKLLAGTRGAFGIIGRFKPDVVLLTGGFVGVPVSVAAWARRVPSVVYLPDIEPGLALKVMAKLATKVATTTEASAQFIPSSKMVVTGYPVREVFSRVTRESARARFGIATGERVLLVVGGSKGARSINRAITQNLRGLLDLTGLKIIHVSGTRDWEEVRAARERLLPEQQVRYIAFQYLHEEMADAMAAADLVVCRSGASALGELPFLGLPAVLVPYPHAWRYQKVNAQYLVDRGAAVILEDARLASELTPLVQGLLNDAAKLDAMRVASLGLGRREGAEAIAQLLIGVGSMSGRT
jgi:UDP-N-acetylglucosamine--N-acetylmuramyl-(pentapeptide) pyrophosphoryl-undecaprenol N-acetylglucosamine transferase